MPTTIGYRLDGGIVVLGERSVNAQLPPPETTAKASKKRKAPEPTPAIDMDDIDLEGEVMDANCDQVRRKILKFLDSGEMNKGQFAKAIGVSGKSLSDFLGQNGSIKGAGSASYGGAWEFFKKREIAGIKMPTKKQKATPATGNAATASVAKSIDISGISLSGEATDSVPVYDSCDEIRKKINAHLGKPGVTQAQFCRDLVAQLHLETRKIQSKQLTDFRSKKGARSGNTSIVFYTAYVYFEKLRLAEGKPKSKHREEMEGVHPGGFDVTRVDTGRYWCMAGERPSVDKLGRVSFY